MATNARTMPRIRDNDWAGLRRALNTLSKLSLGPEASPTFAGITLGGDLDLANNNIINCGNITGSDTDLSLGTGNYSSSGTIISGDITIFDATPILIFRDSDSAGSASVGFIEWRDSNNGRAGFFGNSSSGNDDLLWKNEQGGDIVIQTTGAGEFAIFADTVLNNNSITGINNLTATGTVQGGQLTSTDDITMQGHLFTMGDASVSTTSVMSFLNNQTSTTMTAGDGLMVFSHNIFVIGDTFLGNTLFNTTKINRQYTLPRAKGTDDYLVTQTSTVAEWGYVDPATLDVATAVLASTVTVADESSDTTCFPAFFTDATGGLPIKTDADGLTYNANTKSFGIGGDLSVDDYVGIGKVATSGERLNVLMSATDTSGIMVDGDTAPFLNPDATSFMINKIARTISGTTGRYPTTGVGTFAQLVIDASYSGTAGVAGVKFRNKSWQVLSASFGIRDSIELTDGGAVFGLTYMGGKYDGTYQGTWSQNQSTPRDNEFSVLGGFFQALNGGTYLITNGTHTAEFKGGVFRSDQLSPIYSVGIPTINYIGGDFIANGETTSDSTSIAGRFSAVNSDTNIAIQVLAGTSELRDTNIGDGTNELQVSATGDLLFAGTATVFNDIQFSISTAKVPASNFPSWDNFGANTKKFTFAVNDFLDLEPNEVHHSYREGSNLICHVHFYNNGVDGTDRTVKYQLDIGVTNPNAAYSESQVSEQFTIPASTPDKTHLILTITTFDGTGIEQGADITIRVTRIVESSGTAPSGDPFVSMVGVHIEESRIGSRTELAA